VWKLTKLEKLNKDDRLIMQGEIYRVSHTEINHIGKTREGAYLHESEVAWMQNPFA